MAFGAAAAKIYDATASIFGVEACLWSETDA
jgi:hypothetical protein